MSILKVDSIQSYSGGDVITQGSSKVTANLQVSSSVGYTGVFDGGRKIEMEATGSENSYSLIMQNPNFYNNEYKGIVHNWYQFGGNADLAIGETNRAKLGVNAFANDFSYDNYIGIKADSTGVSFNDWSLPSYGDQAWLTVTQDGPPTFKRGLTIEGLGNYADDIAAAAGGVPVNGLYHTSGSVKIRLT